MDHTKSRGLLRSPLSSPESPTLPSVSAEGKARVDTLLERIESIIITGDLLLESQKSCVTWFQEACVDCDTLKYFTQKLHHYWLSNHQAVVKAALFLCANWMAEVDGVKLRNEILSILEEDFIDRQSMQAKSPEKFLNSAAFLVEIFTRIRIEQLPLSVLTTPVFEYFNDLLSGDESEIQLLAHLLIKVTPTLAVLQKGGVSGMVSYTPLQAMFTKVRSTLMSRNLSSVSRLWLLFIVDISSGGLLKLPSSSLQEFYKDKDHLGKSVDDLLKSLQDLQPCERKDVPELRSGTILETHNQNNLTSSVSVIKNEIDVNHKVQALKITEKTSAGTKKRSPPKVENHDKRDSFRSAFNLDNNVNRGKSYWLHDDRFEKDETSPREKKSDNLTRPRANQSNWRHSSNPKSDKDTSPKSSNDSNWRQSSVVQSSAAPTLRSDEIAQDLTALAGHIPEENWD